MLKNTKRDSAAGVARGSGAGTKKGRAAAAARPYREVSCLAGDQPRRRNWQVKWRMSSASQVISRPRLISLRRS